MARIRLAVDSASKLTESRQWSTSEIDERAYWIDKLDRQIQEWVRYFDRHLRWATILLAPPDEFLLPLGQRAIEARRKLLRQLPSWGELASEDADVLYDILGIEADRDTLSPKLIAWMADLRTEFEKARALARQLLLRAHRLTEMCNDLTASMDMSFLYDPDRRLFSIGYVVG